MPADSQTRNTGIACPACEQPIAVVEAVTTGGVVLSCAGCGTIGTPTSARANAARVFPAIEEAKAILERAQRAWRDLKAVCEQSELTVWLSRSERHHRQTGEKW